MNFYKKLVAAIVIIETIVGLLLTIPSIIIAVELTKISWMMQLYHWLALAYLRRCIEAYGVDVDVALSKVYRYAIEGLW